MPVDSQVVNGRIIALDGMTPSSMEIDDGRIIGFDSDLEVWRTVDASGYYVLPGAVQPGDPTGEHALTLVKQGITTAVVHVSGSLDDLRSRLDQLAREAAIDYCVCWEPADQRLPDDIQAARNLGVVSFAFSDPNPSADLRHALAHSTVRVNPGTAIDSDWLYLPHNATLVLPVSSDEDLQYARSVAARAESRTALELDAGALASGTDALWDAIASGAMVQNSTSPGGPPLLQTLYLEGVHKRGMPLDLIASTCAMLPAIAYRIYPAKGSLAPGADADFVVFDPGQVTEMNGETIPGKVVYAQLRGDILLFNDELHVMPGNGRMLSGQ